jgi:hypothetical protein
VSGRPAIRPSSLRRNGGIDTGFPLTVKGKLNRHSLGGTIGDGGGGLNLQTVSGGIQLRKSS